MIWFGAKEFAVWKAMQVHPWKDEIETLEKRFEVWAICQRLSKGNQKQAYYIDDDGEPVTSIVVIKNVFLPTKNQPEFGSVP